VLGALPFVRRFRRSVSVHGANALDQAYVQAAVRMATITTSAMLSRLFADPKEARQREIGRMLNSCGYGGLRFGPDGRPVRYRADAPVVNVIDDSTFPMFLAQTQTPDEPERMKKRADIRNEQSPVSLF
jgi:hypothetical protein